MKKTITSLSIASAIWLAVPMASAQQSSDLKACAAIEDSLERLVCYDNLAKDKDGKQRGKAKGEQMRNQRADERAAEQAQRRAEKEVKKTKPQANDRFGLEHKNDDADEPADRIEVEVANRREDPYGNWVITLQNGQVWKQTESESYFGWPDDERYFIERGAFNSFYFSREGSNRRFRVQRVK